MREHTIATRYARALLQSIKPETFEKVEQHLVSLKKIFEDQGVGLLHIMVNPAFQIEERKAVIEKIGETLHLEPVLAKLLQILIERGRIKHLSLIVDAFIAALDEKLGRVRAQITASHEMSEQAERQLLDALHARVGRAVIAQINIDDSLLGGVKANVGGLLFDGTVAAKLRRFEKVLSQTASL